MQFPRNHKTLSACRHGIVTSIIALSLQSSLAGSVAAQRAYSGGKLAPVHLWVAGRTLPLKTPALTDSQETYIPIQALWAVGAEFKVNSDKTAVHVWLASQRSIDLNVTNVNGKPMLPLSDVAEALNASVETSAQDSQAKPTFRSADTVYLLARVTGAYYERGALHVHTSFPVPFHSRMLLETNPVRGYVDCVGASVSDDLRPAPVPPDEKRVLKVRVGQNSPTIARIVVELSQGAALKITDAKPGPVEFTVGTIERPVGNGDVDAVAAAGTRNLPDATKPAGNGFSARNTPAETARDTGQHEASPLSGSASDTVPPPPGPNDPSYRIVTPKPARGSVARLPVPPPPPVEVRGLSINTDDPSLLRFQLATGGKVHPTVRYTLGTTQMLVDLPNALLKLPDNETEERSLSHPLISGVRLETIQTPGGPLTRLTLDTSRVLGYSLNAQDGSVSLELRIPRNATGVLADKLIVVDAGHGGRANGADGGGLYEKNITLGIALRLRAELEDCGARVVMTRTQDTDVSLSERCRIANEAGADLFISIHNDSNERANSASGTSTYFHNADPSGRALATCVQHAVMATTGLGSRGVLSDTVMYHSGFAVLRGSTMPAVLCEVAYINNSGDRRKLVDAEFQQRVAKAMCDGLRNYVEGAPKRAQPTIARPMPGDMDSKSIPSSESGSTDGAKPSKG